MCHGRHSRSGRFHKLLRYHSGQRLLCQAVAVNCKLDKKVHEPHCNTSDSANTVQGLAQTVAQSQGRYRPCYRPSFSLHLDSIDPLLPPPYTFSDLGHGRTVRFIAADMVLCICPHDALSQT
jgi:hypothetical protein